MSGLYSLAGSFATLRQRLYEKRSLLILYINNNQGSLILIRNLTYHERTKYIDICYHFIREKEEDGTMKVGYLLTKEISADRLTKPLNRVSFVIFREFIGMIS